MHPSGVDYQWVFGMGRREIGWDDLTEITVDQANQFYQELEIAMVENGYFRVKPAALGSLVGPPARATRSPTTQTTARISSCSAARWRRSRSIPSTSRPMTSGSARSLRSRRHVAATRPSTMITWRPGRMPNPDNSELTREKWDSVEAASLGWSFIADLAQAHGFSEAIAAGFEALPPLEGSSDDGTPPPAPPANAPTASHEFVARRYVERFGRTDTVYVPELKQWRTFKDGIWVDDPTAVGKVNAFCVRIGQILLNQAMSPQDIAKAERLYSEPFVAATARLIRSRPGCAVALREFDSRPFLLGVPGGYIDEKGVLRDPDPGPMLSRQLTFRPAVTAAVILTPVAE
jgi:hypothetical protein